MNITELLTHFEGVKESANGYMAKCPAHDDSNPSLSIASGNENILIYCHAGCTYKAVLAAAGLSTGDLFIADSTAEQFVAAYDYVDEHGELLYQKIRKRKADGDKTFSQRRPSGKGGWTKKLDDVRRVLYRLPEVMKAIDTGETVFICEGEKDADNLRLCGFTATTNGEGAAAEGQKSKWRSEYNGMLRGADVVILPDNDSAGEAHAQSVAKALLQVCKSVRVLRLPDLPPKGDVTDWLTAGGTPEELRTLADHTPQWTPAETGVGGNEPDGTPAPAVLRYKSFTGTLVTTDELVHEEIDWLAYGFFARKRLTEIVGLPGAGKSLFAQAMFQHQSGNRSGITMQGNLKCLYILGADMDASDMELRKGIGGEFRLLHNTEDLNLDFNHSEPTLAERIEHKNKTGCDYQSDTDKFIEAFGGKHLDAIVFDTKRKFFTGKTNDDETAAKVMTNLRRLANELNVAVVLLSHGRKNTAHATPEIVEGSSRWAGDLDICWYVQNGKNSIYQISNVKRRAFPEMKPLTLKCEFGKSDGFVATTEAFEVDAPQTNSGLLASGNGEDGEAAPVSETRFAVLRAIEELGNRATPAEITELTGHPKGRVRQHLYQARGKDETTLLEDGTYQLTPSGKKLIRLPEPFTDSPNAPVSLYSPNALTDTINAQIEVETPESESVRALGVRATDTRVEALGHTKEPDKLSIPQPVTVIEPAAEVPPEVPERETVEGTENKVSATEACERFYAERLAAVAGKSVSMHMLDLELRNFCRMRGWPESPVALRAALRRRKHGVNEKMKVYYGLQLLASQK